MSKDDITLLLLGGASTEKMVALIQQRGVDFQMNPDFAKKFHDAGADDAVIEALQKAGEKAKVATPVTTTPAGGGETPSATSAPPGAASQLPGAGSNPPAGANNSNAEQKVEQIMKELGSSPGGESGDYQLAPSFSLKGITGQRLSLADYKGKVVILDFWATWCGPCRSQIPQFVELQDRYRDEGFSIIGIVLDDHLRAVQQFYRQYYMNYAVAMGDREVRASYGGIRALPTTFLIGRDGRIHYKLTGASNVAALEERVKTLIAVGETGPAKAPPLVPTTRAASPAPTPTQGPAASSAPSSASEVGSSSANTGASNGRRAPKGDIALSDPGPDRIQQIIQEFAAKEKLFKEARNNYTYHQINKVETLDADGNVDGTFEQDWDILYDDSGKRIERVTYAPPDTLTRVLVTAQDLDSMRNIQPFVLTSAELGEYEIKYLGHVRVDEITAYVFSIRPKEIKKGRQYFQGVVWVDDRDLQIVKSEGKPVPELRTKKGENLFPRFTTYREQIDGKYWFPTFTMADDTLYFSESRVHIKQVIRYSDYKQFKAKVRILGVTPTDQPGPPSKPQ